MNGVENLCAVISRSAGITNTYYNLFEDNKTFFVLEGLPVNSLWSNGAIAVLT